VFPDTVRLVQREWQVPVEDEDDIDEGSPEDTPLIKQLRSQLKDQAKQLGELNGTKKESAFIKAGVDVETKVGKLFFNSFDGDLADIEAIRKEAEELGIPPVVTGAPTMQQQQAAATAGSEDTGSQLRNELSNGAASNEVVEKSPLQEAREKAEEIRKLNGP
jgi:hypothetical protein